MKRPAALQCESYGIFGSTATRVIAACAVGGSNELLNAVKAAAHQRQPSGRQGKAYGGRNPNPYIDPPSVQCLFTS